MNREMIESDVEWIGEIPKEWEVVKFNKIIERIATGLNPRDNFNLGFGENYYVTIKNFKNGILYLDEKCDKVDDLALLIINKRSNLQINDILFASIGIEGHAYLIDQIPKNWDINESVFTIRPNISIILPKLLYYIITSRYFYDNLSIGATGTTFKSIKIKALKENLIVIPLFSEQQKISDYLDKKVSEIDNIITQTTLSIEEYKKYKQSLIFEVVTKGLNANAEMIESGIEWVGMIPENWEVKKMKYYGLLDSSGVDKKIREDETTYKSIHYMDVYRGSLSEIEKNDAYLIISTTSDKAERCLLRKGDVLFTNSSETPEDIGHSSVIKEDLFDTLFGYHLMRFRPITKFSLEFEKYLFGSHYLRKWFEYCSVGMTRYGISHSAFSEALLIVPPFEEQMIIADYLDKKNYDIDNLIAQKKRLLTELEIYKKSLIYECVTGKRVVN